MAGPDQNAPARVGYLDLLRILAALGVVTLHVSATNLDAAPVGSPVWSWFALYNTAATWALPTFVMISGALFLGRDRDIRTLITKHVGRMALVFVFWSALYAAVAALASPGMSKKDLFIAFMGGHYHLWFLFLISGLYLITPLVRQIARSPRLTAYFLALALVFGVLLPEAAQLLSDAPTPFIARVGRCAAGLLDNVAMRFTAGYVGYFVLGYFLSVTEVPRRVRRAVYLLGIAGFGLTYLMFWRDSVAKQAISSTYAGAYNIHVTVQIIAIFLFLRYNLPALQKGRRWPALTFLGRCSFGVYLIHPLVIERINPLLGLDTLAFPAPLSVPGIVLFVFGVSLAGAALLRQIPGLRRVV